MAIKEALKSIKIDAAPSAGILRQLWQQIEADPLRPMLLSDTTTFLSSRHFLAAVGHSILPFVAYVDGEPAGSAWLYNIVMLPPLMIPVSAFTAGYVLPAFRRHGLRRQYEQAYMAHLVAMGMQQLWAEVRVGNLTACHALRASGFHRVAVLPAWHLYAGQWCDMVLYHRRMPRMGDPLNVME